MLQEFVQTRGEGLVAERLGISVEELNRKFSFAGDFTMTELRLLCIAAEVKMQYKLFLSE